MFVDDIMLDQGHYYSTGVFVPGAPYQSIDKVWVEGRVFQKHRMAFQPWRDMIQAQREDWKRTHQGKRFPWDTYDEYPEFGMVDFLNKTEPPNGSFIIEATKDDTTHPCDQLEDILGKAGMSTIVNQGSFKDVKTANPNDECGCFFDDIEAGKAISNINQRMLYDIFMKQSKINLMSYNGQPPGSSVLTLTSKNCACFEQPHDMGDVNTVITTKWGWAQKYKKLMYRAKDQALIDDLGEQEQELDFSYGSEVMSDNADMAKAKAELLLKRMKGARERIIATGDLRLARVELGDGVTVSNKNLNDDDLIYEVMEKIINLTDKTVELTLMRFWGEE